MVKDVQIAYKYSAAKPRDDFAEDVSSFERWCPATGPQLPHRRAVVERYWPLLASLRREVLCIVCLDKHDRAIAEFRIAGTAYGVKCYPHQLARHAAATGCASVLLVHNHPSGDPTPSGPDLSFTNTVHDLLKNSGIRLLDHVIVASSGHSRVEFT